MQTLRWHAQAVCSDPTDIGRHPPLLLPFAHSAPVVTALNLPPYSSRPSSQLLWFYSLLHLLLDHHFCFTPLSLFRSTFIFFSPSFVHEKAAAEQSAAAMPLIGVRHCLSLDFTILFLRNACNSFFKFLVWAAVLWTAVMPPWKA